MNISFFLHRVPPQTRNTKDPLTFTSVNKTEVFFAPKLPFQQTVEIIK